MSQKATEATSKVDQMKDKYPDARIVEFSDGAVAVIAKPSRVVVGLMAVNNRDKGPLAAIETLLTNCWVDGDEAVKQEPGYALGMLALMDDLIGTKTAELKN